MMSGRDEAAGKLAQIHYESASTTAIYCVDSTIVAGDQAEEPIKLLEVNEDTIPSGIVPLWFGPLPERGIDYVSVIIEVTPEEYEQIENGTLPLPQGWEKRHLVQRPPELVSTSE